MHSGPNRSQTGGKKDFLRGPTLALVSGPQKHGVAFLWHVSVILLHHVVGESFLNDGGGGVVAETKRHSWTPSGLASTSERTAALAPRAEY